MARAAQKQTTEMTEWEAELARRTQLARGMAAATSTGEGNKISIKSGIMTYQGNPVPGSKLNAIVVANVAENHWYEEEYDSDNPQPPDCYAFAATEEEVATMKPHPQSAKPQSETCATCPKNKFGSAERGKGKACKNTHKLALLTEDVLDKGSDILGATPATLFVPPTSGKAWTGFVKSVADTFNRPPLAVVTEISCAPDPKVMVKVSAKLVRKIDDGKAIMQLIKKGDIAQQDLVKPYAAMERNEAPANNKNQKFAKNKPAARKR